MPIYEYRCQACGHEFEREQRITEEPVRTCPQCRADQAKRMISRTSFVLKGGGWYSDLYASADAKKKPDAGAKSDAAAPAGAESASGSDSGTDKPKKKDAAKGEAKKGSGGGSGASKPSKGAKGSAAA